MNALASTPTSLSNLPAATPTPITSHTAAPSSPPSERTAPWLRALVWSVNAGIVGAAGYAVADRAVAWWHDQSVDLHDVSASVPDMKGDARVATSTVDYAQITGWHLFGQAPPNARGAARSTPPPPPPPPVTPLNLRVVGVFFAEKADKYALALIAEGNGVERSYRPGDALPGGGALLSVQHDRIVVAHNGREETFELPKRSDLQSLSGAPPTAVTSNLPTHTTPATHPASAPIPPDDSADTPTEEAPSVEEETSTPEPPQQMPMDQHKRRRFPFNNSRPAP